MNGARILTGGEAPTEVGSRIRGGLLRYNEEMGGAAFEPFHAYAEGEEGALLGGLLGYYRLGCLFIEKFWLEDACRGQGLGSRLLREAEEHARARGCRAMQLDTYDFQALPFYRKHEFEVLGELNHLEDEHTKYFLVKRLG